MIHVKYLVVTFLLISAILIVFRIIVKQGYQRKGKLTPFTTLVQLLLFFLHALSSYIYIETRGHHISKGSLLEIIGIILMIIGGGFTLFGMINLGIKKSFGAKAQGLKQTGFYKYSRNPQIVFYLLFLIGYAMIYPGWTGLIWIGILLLMCHIMIITEEEHLLRTFSEQYKIYCKETPRYIGLKIFKQKYKVNKIIG